MKVKQPTVQQSAYELMQRDMDCARKCYSRAKDGIIEAIAHVFLVYRTVENSSNAAEKIDAEINIRNSKIDGHNKHQQDDRDRAQRLTAGKLAGNHLGKDERVRLNALAALSDDAWRVKYIKLAIEPRTDANARSRIVKHLFDLDSRADAPNASRYTKAVQWIHDNCSAANGATEIVTSIKDAGGLDKVIELQRLADKPPEGAHEDVPTVSQPVEFGTFSDSEGISPRPLALTYRQSLNAVTPLTSFEMDIKAKPNDLLLLVGRYRKGTVEIVKATPLSDDGLLSVLDIFDTTTLAAKGQRHEAAARKAA